MKILLEYDEDWLIEFCDKHKIKISNYKLKTTKKDGFFARFFKL